MKTLWIISFLIYSLIAFSQPPSSFTNPVIPGFHPDPSVCRVGENYYLVNSSFEWFPGIPVFHSKDLVNWNQIGHVLDRPSQLNLEAGLAHSNGIWAPTIRYHKGLFYVIATCQQCGGNFYVTATNPAGPWSDPVFIEDSPGIDPELFFDEDGKSYYIGSSQGKWGPPRRWKWEDRIYIQEIDLATGKLLGEKIHLTSGHASNAKWCEGPHIVKRKNRYYLFTGEGGTWNNHSVTCFISDKVTGPYKPLDANPVLTHRHLGKTADITTIGHADLVQTRTGEWYAVMLGVRPFEGYRNLGRETFLTSVSWEGDQPVFNPGIGRVLMEDKRPDLPWHPFPEIKSRDEFDGKKPGVQWNFLRTPYDTWYKQENGKVHIRLRPAQISETGNPSLMIRRQEHHRFKAYTEMHFIPENDTETAGLVIMQNNKFNYQLLVSREGEKQFIKLVKTGKEGARQKKEVFTEEMARVPWNESPVILGIRANGLEYRFFYGKKQGNMHQIGDVQDGRILSSNWAGGFTGTYLGMYASSNGKKSNNSAKFEYFEYKGITKDQKNK